MSQIIRKEKLGMNEYNEFNLFLKFKLEVFKEYNNELGMTIKDFKTGNKLCGNVNQE